jgi:predicted nucleic acid-binding Zn ribbon protein
MKRCSYCGKKINGSVGFCSDACESRYKKGEYETFSVK